MSDTPAETEARTEDRTDRQVRTRDSQSIKWLSGIVSLVGLWIAVSPTVYETTDAMLWNNVIVGLGIFLLAGYNYYRMANGYAPSVGVATVVAALGLWSVVAPFLLEVVSTELLWSTVVSGIVVAALAGYNAYAGRSARAPAAETRV